MSRSFTARNSAIVQERGCLTPLLQGSGPTAGSWIPQLAAEWSWPGDGYARDGTVWVYATRLGEIGPGVFGFEARAVDLVEIDQATLTIRRIHRNRYAAAPVLLGSSVTTDGTWTYVYGRDERGSKRNTYVARVPAPTRWPPPPTGRARRGRPTPARLGPSSRPTWSEDRRSTTRPGLRGQAVRGGREGRRVPHELGRAVHRAGHRPDPGAKVTTVPAAGLAPDSGTFSYMASLHGIDAATGGLHLTWNINSFDGAAVERDVHAYGEVHHAVPVNLRVPAGAPAVPAASAVGTGGGLAPVTPTRVVDTRVGQGGSSRLIGGQVVAFPIAGQAGVPATATSVVAATFTVVDPRLSGFLTVFPCGRAMPVASSLNYLAGEVVPNTITASLGSRGSGLRLSAARPRPGRRRRSFDRSRRARVAGVAPTRLLDTRSGLGGRRLPAGGQIAVAVSGRGGVPAGAVAAAVNVTATEASRASYVTAWPCDQPRPLASVVNIVPGRDPGRQRRRAAVGPRRGVPRTARARPS